MIDMQQFADEYQPTTSYIMLRALSSFDVLHKLPNDFANERGSYVAYLDYRFSIISTRRLWVFIWGSAIDMASFPKIHTAIIDNKIISYTNYDGLILLIIFLVDVIFMLTGGPKDARLAWSKFCFDS